MICIGVPGWWCPSWSVSWRIVPWVGIPGWWCASLSVSGMVISWIVLRRTTSRVVAGWWRGSLSVTLMVVSRWWNLRRWPIGSVSLVIDTWLWNLGGSSLVPREASCITRPHMINPVCGRDWGSTACLVRHYSVTCTLSVVVCSEECWICDVDVEIRFRCWSVCSPSGGGSVSAFTNYVSPFWR